MPWEFIEYMIGDIQYGGRITDEWDMKVLKCLTQKYFNPDILLEKHKFIFKVGSRIATCTLCLTSTQISHWRPTLIIYLSRVTQNCSGLTTAT